MDVNFIFKPEFEPYREALAAWEAYRRLGFEAEEITFVVQPYDTHNGILMQLNTQNKTFAYGCGGVIDKPENIHGVWQHIGTIWNEKLTEKQRHKIYLESKVRKQAVQLLIALNQKGFDIPYEKSGRLPKSWTN